MPESADLLIDRSERERFTIARTVHIHHHLGLFPHAFLNGLLARTHSLVVGQIRPMKPSTSSCSSFRSNLCRPFTKMGSWWASLFRMSMQVSPNVWNRSRSGFRHAAFFKIASHSFWYFGSSKFTHKPSVVAAIRWL